MLISDPNFILFPFYAVCCCPNRLDVPSQNTTAQREAKPQKTSFSIGKNKTISVLKSLLS